MIKYAKIIDFEKGICQVGIGSNTDFYQSVGMSELDVELSEIDNQWYLADVCPHKTDEEKLIEAKNLKYKENQEKLDIARVGHTFTVTLQGYECTFDTKDKTQNDLNSAMISANAGYPWKWTTNNKIKIDLQVEDIVIVSNAFQELVNKDINKWTYFETLIDNAETVTEVNQVLINYDIELGETNNVESIENNNSDLGGNNDITD